VWFYPAPADAAVGQPPKRKAGRRGRGGDVVVLDVRGLEPPEPMMQTLAALEALPPGAVLVQLNARPPQFLLPILEERGFTYEIRQQEPDLVRIFIRRTGEA
jgi:tRNA 2-thiouridine synthesizing protein A